MRGVREEYRLVIGKSIHSHPGEMSVPSGNVDVSFPVSTLNLVETVTVSTRRWSGLLGPGN